MNFITRNLVYIKEDALLEYFTEYALRAWAIGGYPSDPSKLGPTSPVDICMVNRDVCVCVCLCLCVLCP